jgi:hypothetical protein
MWDSLVSIATCCRLRSEWPRERASILCKGNTFLFFITLEPALGPTETSLIDRGVSLERERETAGA